MPARAASPACPDWPSDAAAASAGVSRRRLAAPTRVPVCAARTASGAARAAATVVDVAESCYSRFGLPAWTRKMAWSEPSGL